MAAGRYGPLGYKDLTGKRFGKLLVISLSEKRGHKRIRLWNCICDCGNTKLARGDSLRDGSCTSCGCNQISWIKNFTHTVYEPEEGDHSTLFSAFKSRAKVRNIENNLDFSGWLSVALKPCVYCGRIDNPSRHDLKCKDLKINGVDRIDSSRGYFLDNVAPACKDCNCMKLDHSHEEFLEHISLIYNYLRLNKENSVK